MNNYDLIKFFFSQENEKMINEKILDDVDYVVPKDRILEYINKVIDIPYADFIAYLKDNPNTQEIDSSHITQCSSFIACEASLCEVLLNENNPGLEYAEIGILLSSFISSNKSGALRKYGENQIKTAFQLGLAFEYYNHWYLSCLGYVYLDLDNEKRLSILARTLLRDPLYAKLIIDITQRDIYLKDYMDFLSVATINRRFPSVVKLLSICLSECNKYDIQHYNILDIGCKYKQEEGLSNSDDEHILDILLKDNSGGEPQKSKTEILRVEFPDGRVIQHKKVVDTFVEVIENNFPDLIHELNILHANVNLVTRERSQQYASAQREISDGWLVFTNINTRKKREDLIKISNELELDLKVDIVSVTTGEIIDVDDEPSTSTRQKIKVTFPDGKTIQPNKVLETLVEVVKYAGPERVRDLGIIVCADNLVLKTPKPRYAKLCKPVGNGWLVNTCSDTPTKYEQIQQISDRLELGLSVEMTNGENTAISYTLFAEDDSSEQYEVGDNTANYVVSKGSSEKLCAGISISDYSSKSFALYGDTLQYEEFLRSQYGSYNKHLPEGPGWLFSKKREGAIREFFNNISRHNNKVTTEDVCSWISNLRTFKVGDIRYPHKPVYLLSIIKLVSNGSIEDKIYLDQQLIDVFEDIWNKVVVSSNSFAIDICNPYIHMASEPFYGLHLVKDIPYTQIKKNISAIREVCDYAYISAELKELILDKEQCRIIIEHIIKEFGLREVDILSDKVAPTKATPSIYKLSSAPARHEAATSKRTSIASIIMEGTRGFKANVRMLKEGANLPALIEQMKKDSITFDMLNIEYVKKWSPHRFNSRWAYCDLIIITDENRESLAECETYISNGFEVAKKPVKGWTIDSFYNMFVSARKAELKALRTTPTGIVRLDKEEPIVDRYTISSPADITLDLIQQMIDWDKQHNVLDSWKQKVMRDVAYGRKEFDENMRYAFYLNWKALTKRGFPN